LPLPERIIVPESSIMEPGTMVNNVFVLLQHASRVELALWGGQRHRKAEADGRPGLQDYCTMA
jgi:hypothetical protein